MDAYLHDMVILKVSVNDYQSRDIEAEYLMQSSMEYFISWFEFASTFDFGGLICISSPISTTDTVHK